MAASEQLPLGLLWDESTARQRIASIATILRGRGPVYEAGSGKITVNQKCVRWTGIDLTHAKEVSAAWVASLPPQYMLRDGDIVVNSTGEGTIGRACVVSREAAGLPFDSHILVVRTQKETLLPAHLGYYLRSEEAQTAIEDSKSAKTTKQTELGVAKLGEITIPVPPLAEQRRIVARIEAWTSRLNQVQELREHSAAHVVAALVASMAVVFPSEVDPAWPELSEYVEYIENGWSPQCLPNPAEPGEWGVLKVGAVSSGRFVGHENKALPPELSPRPELEVRHGDFLMGRANTAELTGACAIVNDPPPQLMLCDKIFRFHFRAQAQIDVRYLDYALKSKPLRKQIEAGATGTSSSMKNISKDKVLRLRLPLPALDEQRNIVAYLDSIKTKCSTVQRLQAESRAEIVATLPALLARAFRGEI